MKGSIIGGSHSQSSALKIKTASQRRKYWLERSGAMYEMSFNSLYYYRLLKEKRNYSSKYTQQIERDLHRTFPEDEYFKNPKSFETLQNILTAYSWRNPNVGYCQGMNFIAGRFLTLGFSEVESFWMLVQVIERYLPFEYYSTMTGVMIDQKIFDFLLRSRLPKVARAFDRLEINSSLITVQWFTCMYAYTFPKNVVARIWDDIFTEGYGVIYRVSLAVFWMAQKDILNKHELTEIFDCVERKCSSITNEANFTTVYNKKLFRINHLLLEKLKDTAIKEVNAELSERMDNILTEKEVLRLISSCCKNNDECKQKNLMTTAYFTFLADENIDVDENYFERENDRKVLNVSLLREADCVMVGKKNHICGLEDEEEFYERVHVTDVKSSFLVMADDVRDMVFD